MKEIKQRRSLTLNEKFAVNTIKNAIRGQFISTRPENHIEKCQCCGADLCISNSYIGSICWRCGWEQDLIEDVNEESSMNYGFSCSEYSKLYDQVVKGKI